MTQPIFDEYERRERRRQRLIDWAIIIGGILFVIACSVLTLWEITTGRMPG